MSGTRDVDENRKHDKKECCAAVASVYSIRLVLLWSLIAVIVALASTAIAPASCFQPHQHQQSPILRSAQGGTLLHQRRGQQPAVVVVRTGRQMPARGSTEQQTSVCWSTITTTAAKRRTVDEPESSDSERTEDETSCSIDSNNDTETHTTNTEQQYYSYTLEYSPNFHRHVVRRRASSRRRDDENGSNSSSSSSVGQVVQSFLWLDEALQTFPTATLLPVQGYPKHRLDTCLYDSNSNNSGISCCELLADDDDGVAVLVAGGGLNESTAYPVFILVPPQQQHLDDATTTDPAAAATVEVASSQNNSDQIYEIFQSLLMWYPVQVDTLMKRWPPLRSYPAELLCERLQFLLAPLPDDDAVLLHQANVTDDVDWPFMFHHDHCGAGMSVAQVSHALQVLPEPLLLRLNYQGYAFLNAPMMMAATDATGGATGNNAWQYSATSAAALTHLYDLTPPLVLQMTVSVLHLWVTGVTHLDTVSLAYLHWRGWEWQACRIVLHAFRCSLSSNLEPNWELHERRNTVAPRKMLIPESLSYLQTRLQVRPWHVHAMLKTHGRLSGYTPVKLKRNLDFLQERLQLRSAELQALILVMPSLLGAGTDALESRIAFFTARVGLTVSQLRDAAIRKPALLQYSVAGNLEPKAEFFSTHLCLDNATLARMTCANPELWGRSLDRYLWPMARAFCSICGGDIMTLAEYGHIVARVPELLLYSIQNLQNKLEFLRDRLGLTGSELKDMVQTTPSILKQSISTSLQPKIELIESLGRNQACNREAMLSNPSLLVIPKASLQQRLQRSASFSSELSLCEALKKSAKKNGRPSKAIWLLSGNDDKEVELEFSEVAAAASHAETSQSTMYKTLRLRRLLKGRQYVYANTTAPPGDQTDVSTNDEVELLPAELSLQKEIRQKYVLEGESHTPHLIIHTAGRAFPPEDTVRGRKRSGGMALQIQSWSAIEWRQTCSNLWKGLRLRLLPDSNTLIVGYPYTRPSRPRCSLYACREALRVATEWLSLVSTPNAAITIVCESNYVLDLLQNTTQILEWGRAETKNDFVFTGQGELYKANPDILYPLSRTYFHLVEQDKVLTAKKNVTVHFVAADTNDDSRRLRDGANLAAKLMYDSVR